jgi:hypothetical protein
MALVNISSRRIREAAAKLPTPTKDKPDSAIDAGIRKSAESHAVGDETVVGSSQLLERIDELLAEPAPVSAETKLPKAAPAKPAEPPKAAE